MNESLDGLLTEARHPETRDLDALSPLEFVMALSRADEAVVPAVRAAAPRIAEAIEAAAARLAGGGRMHYFGAGTSGRLALLDAVECPPTFGTAPEIVQAHLAGGEAAFARAREGAEDSAEEGRADVDAARVGSADIVVGVAASGRTPYVVGALERARERGAATVAIVCAADGPVARAADVAIELLTGPEALSGSTRLKAGTAQKMALNMLSTGVMARLGRVYDNLMVDVRATNEKLRLRARRIVRQVSGVDDSAADAALSQCGGEAKPACLVAALGLSAEEAKRRLAEACGSLREALRG